MSRKDDILRAYLSGEDFDVDVKLYSDKKISFYRGGARFKVDTVFITFEPWNDPYPFLQGFAHSDNGDYSGEYLEPDDIINVDLYDYMEDEAEPYFITDFEGLVADHPEIFYS